MCSFCNQRKITGQSSQPTAEDVQSTIIKALSDLGDKTVDTEIAFFGGSFTAVDRGYMISLLDATKPYIQSFKGIRISTRPDYIDDEILILLKKYNVTTIELGAQSMSDEVLIANNRGHSAEDVAKASALIKSRGFNLGLQMMTGLYKATPAIDIYTAERFIELSPDCVRIYPTVIMKDTELEALYNSGEYKPYSLEASVELCSELLMMFYEKNIDVIRVGLHYSDSLKSGDVAGIYHPAFKELCENRIFFDRLSRMLGEVSSKDIVISVNPSSVSKLIGQNRANLKRLSDYNIKIIKDPSLDRYGLRVKDNR